MSSFYVCYFIDFPHRSSGELSRIRTIFPQADLQFLDTGHLVQVEAPNEFVKLTTDFINSTTT